MARQVLDRTRWAVTVKNVPTLGGVYEMYQSEIAMKNSRRVKTLAAYDSILNNTICACTPWHNEKPITEYTADDYAAIMENIIRRGQIDPGTETYKPYSQSTLQTFRMLLYRIAYAASIFVRGCENVLFGSFFSLDEDELNDAVSMAVYPSAPSIGERINMYRYLLEDPMTDGQNVILLITLTTGMRINEACALKFGDLKKMDYYSFWEVRAEKSTSPGSNTIKASSKTINGNRFIRIPEAVAEWLIARRDRISGILRERGEKIKIDTLPIGCLGQSYKVHNYTSLIGPYAKKMFEAIGISERGLAVTDVVYRFGDVDEVIRKEVIENEPMTNYLRHSFAVFLEIMQISETQRWYVFGHTLEYSESDRPDFANEDLRAEIWKQLDDPLFGSPSRDTDAVWNGNGTSGYFTCSGEQMLTLDCGEAAEIEIISEEPFEEKLAVTVTEGEAEVYSAAGKAAAHGGIDIRSIYAMICQAELAENGITDISDYARSRLKNFI